MASWFAPINFLTMDEQHRANPVCRSQFSPHDAPDSPESRWLGAPIQTIPDAVTAASPLSYIDGATNLPPFHLENGDEDCLVPGEQTGELAAALRAEGAAVTHLVVPGAGHGRHFPASRQMPGVIRFFDGALKATSARER